MMKSDVQMITFSAFLSTYVVPFLTDGNGLLLGMAFCGSVVFVMSSREISTWAKVFYVPISTFVGFGVASSVFDGVIWQSITAFVVSLLVVLVSGHLLSFVNSDTFVKDILEIVSAIRGRKK